MSKHFFKTLLVITEYSVFSIHGKNIRVVYYFSQLFDCQNNLICQVPCCMKFSMEDEPCPLAGISHHTPSGSSHRHM